MISRLRVVIETTAGYVHYLPFDQNDGSNPFQVHKSGWMPETFTLVLIIIRKLHWQTIHRSVCDSFRRAHEISIGAANL